MSLVLSLVMLITIPRKRNDARRCEHWLKRGIQYFIDVDVFRLPQLDTDFQALLRKEKNWQTPLPYMKNICSDFLHSTNTLVHNIVCASCDIIGHDSALFHNILTNDQSLRVLSVPSDIYVPYDFRSGIPELDNRRVLIDKLGICEDDRLSLCESCYKSITVHRRPHESLSNYRWIGEQPKK